MDDHNQLTPQKDSGTCPPEHPEDTLDMREKRLALRERALQAREALEGMKLPGAYIEYLSLESDEALARGLKMLGALGPRTPGGGSAPKAHTTSPADYAAMTYAQRAALYLADKDGYTQAFEGGK